MLEKYKKHITIGIIAVSVVILSFIIFSKTEADKKAERIAELTITMQNLEEVKKATEDSVEVQKAKIEELKKNLKEIRQSLHDEGMPVVIDEEVKAVANSDIVNALDGELPVEKNSKGEVFTRIKYASGLKEAVEKNCTPEIYAIFDDVVKIAENYKIKPEILFAIAHADSACGRNMTTPNNPGNVGNNDRGNRVGYFTMQEGFEKIAKTLVNKYMSGNTQLWQLSQGGRIDAQNNGIAVKNDCANATAPNKCYATSVENWHANTTRFLRSLGYTDVARFEFKL